MSKTSRKIGYLAVLAVVDAIFFGFINPRKAYALVVVAGFILLVVTIYAIVDLLLALTERAYTFSDMTRHRLHLSITMLLALLIAMQSIGQLTTKDLVAIVPLVLIAAFYISYQRKQTR